MDNGIFLDGITTSRTPGIRRLQVDPGEAAYHEGREYRISYEFAVTATPLVIKFSSPRGFTLYNQQLSIDQGGASYKAWRAAQGSAGGSFSTAIPQWAAKGNAETPAFVNPITITTGGTFTPTGGQTPAETVRLFVSSSGAGPSSVRQTVGGAAIGERGLPAGDYYLVLARLSGTSVDALGVLDLVYAADRDE